MASLLFSVSAFALEANAQVETVAATENTYQEPTALATQTLDATPTSSEIAVPVAPVPVTADEIVVKTEDETTAQEDAGGPQSIVNIPAETEEATTEETATVEDVQTVPSDEAIRKDGQEKAEKIFNAIDADQDGNISKDEFLSFHAKLIERKIIKQTIENATTEETSETAEKTEVSE